MQPQIIKTSDGSHTLYSPDMDEQYHSVNGALTESLHIFIKHGYQVCTEKNKKVFEVGFGTGLNCYLTAIEAEKNRTPTTYVAIEEYPLEKERWQALNYPQVYPSKDQTLFQSIHEAEWGKKVEISTHFQLLKLKLDITTSTLPNLEEANIVYYDAFGPDKQPEMWKLLVIEKVANIMASTGILVTYTVKGSVKRGLKSLGFRIEKVPGPPGKNEILRGYKTP